MIGHSLAPAVADGTITEQEAFCGLTPEHVDALALRHPSCELLVRLRSPEADSRVILRARDLAIWSRSSVLLIINKKGWLPSEIRDVSGIAESSA